ncbi:hypothetical protein [Paenarthrobacter ureafaciens]|uniref:hypothetical protein n=1 Tax=Paenarthrobacter ureafaciens TaxID=37931 RepID=UPI003463BEB8
MRIRRLVRRRAAAKAPVKAVPVAAAAQDDKPLSPEAAEELRAAWAELNAAAVDAKVISFHACTRTGAHWAEDPSTVRAMAALIRESTSQDL